MSDWMGEDMSGGAGDEVFVDFMGPSDAETHILPPMYPVPAAALGILPQGTRVTVGVAGSHWIIEENIICDGPHPGPDGEWYSLVSHAEWGAVTLRPHEQHNVPAGQEPAAALEGAGVGVVGVPVRHRPPRGGPAGALAAARVVRATCAPTWTPRRRLVGPARLGSCRR